MKHRVSLVVAFACAFCFALGLAGCSQAGSYEGKTLTPTISSPTIGQYCIVALLFIKENPPFGGFL